MKASFLALLALLAASGASAQGLTFGELLGAANSTLCPGIISAVETSFPTLYTVLGLFANETTGVTAADLTAALAANNSVALLAPTDAAFAALIKEVPDLTSQTELVVDTLKLHIEVVSPEGNLTSLAGVPITYNRTDVQGPTNGAGYSVVELPPTCKLAVWQLDEVLLPKADAPSPTPSPAGRPPTPSSPAPAGRPPLNVGQFPATPPSPPSSSSSSNTAAIIGGVAAGVAVLAAVAGFLVWRRKKHADVSESSLDKPLPPQDFEAPATLPSVAPPTASLPPTAPSPFLQSLATSAALSRDPLLSSIASSLRSGQLTPASRGSSSGASDLQVIDVADVEVRRVIGGGSFGRVYEGRWRLTPVAVKMLVDSHGVEVARASAAAGSGVAAPPDTLAPALQKEAALMAALRHPNVVQIYGVCTNPPALVQEYCTRGSLTDVYRAAAADSAAAAALTWRRRLGMLRDAAAGLAYLHHLRPPMLHRDLKSPNLLVDEHWRVKVADFGLSKLVAEHSVASQTSAGGATNPRWLAPEIFAGADFSPAADVFALGVVMSELLAWKLPWTGTNEWAIIGQVQAGARPEVPTAPAGPPPPSAGSLEAYKTLMARCWAQDPAARPAAAEVAAELDALAAQA